MRLWQRVFRRAGVPLAYSEGFNPHPRISLAAPLAIGVTTEADLMEVFCTRWMSPHWFTVAIEHQSPPGIRLLQVHSIPLSQPSLQSLVRYAEYKVEVETERDAKDIELALRSLLSTEQLPWQHQRDTGIRSYDLRTLIDDLWLVDWQPSSCTIGMRLRCDSSGSGRPEQVAAALGFAQHPQSMHRTRLTLATV